MVALRLTHPVVGPLTLLAEGGTGEFDNVSAARLYRPARRAVTPPRVGPLLTGWSDEFDDGLDPAWQWIRRNPAATVTDGALRWPVESTDLVGTGNTAGVLLRDAPAGDYVAETKVTLDLGEGTVRNYQQAGLVTYVDDDRFSAQSQVAFKPGRSSTATSCPSPASRCTAAASSAPRPPPPGCDWPTTSTRPPGNTSSGPAPAGTARTGPGVRCGPSRPTPRPGSAWSRTAAPTRRSPPSSTTCGSTAEAGRGPWAVVRTAPAGRFSPACGPCR